MAKPLVLVTGASGYIGAHVIKALQETGYRVRGTVRSLKDPAKVKPLLDLCPQAEHKLELVEADLEDEKSWDKAVEGCTYIQHVASPFVTDVKNEDEVVRPAVQGTMGVLRAAAKTGGVKRIVLTSSAIAVSFTGGNEVPITEKEWTDLQSRDMTPYAKSKHLAEKAAWDFLKELPDNQKFELATVNPVFVFGPPATKSAGTSLTTIRQIFLREMPVLPHFHTDICDVRDVTRAHVECMTRPEAAGNRHIICTKSVTLQEFATILRDEFESQGYNPTSRSLPNGVLWFMSWFHSETASRYRTLMKPLIFDNSRMRNVLGIEPVDAKKTLTDTIYRMIEMGMIDKTDKYRGPPNKL